LKGSRKKSSKKNQYGKFYTGEAYLVHFTYVWKNVDRHVLYFYQGRAASINDKGAAALLTIEMDDKLGRSAREVRVVQNREPKHFMDLFKGKLVISQGRDPSLIDYKPSKLCTQAGNPDYEIKMYDVRGMGKEDEVMISGVQIAPCVMNFHSDHVMCVIGKLKIKKENEEEEEDEDDEDDLDNENQYDDENKNENGDENTNNNNENNENSEKKVEKKKEKQKEKEKEKEKEDYENAIVYAWFGKGSSIHERNFAINLLTEQGYQDIQKVEEGSEPFEFWELFGGRPPKFLGDFTTVLNNNNNNSSNSSEVQEIYSATTFLRGRTPRLFQCSVGTGIFGVEEIVSFSQEDLNIDDVMVLDALYAVYVWIGKQSSEIERKMGMQTSIDYIKAGSNRENVPCYYILEGLEPLEFTVHFHGWQWGSRRTDYPFPAPLYAFDDGMRGWPQGKQTMVQEMLNEYFRKYTYDDLKNKRFPKGLNVHSLEGYLEDDEFKVVFNMTKEEFFSLNRYILRL